MVLQAAGLGWKTAHLPVQWLDMAAVLLATTLHRTNCTRLIVSTEDHNMNGHWATNDHIKDIKHR